MGIFTSEAVLLEATVGIFVAVLIIILATVYKIFLSSDSINSQKSLMNTFLGYAYKIQNRALLQPLTTIFCYFLLLFFSEGNNGAVKSIELHLFVQNSWEHIMLFAMSLVSFIATLAVSLACAIFLSDFSLVGASMWASNSCYGPMLETLARIIISGVFILDAEVGLLRQICRCLRPASCAWRWPECTWR